MQQLLALALHQTGNRNTGPTLDNAGNFFIGNLVTQQGVLALCLLGLCFFLFQLLFQFRQTAVFEFRSLVEVISLFCAFDIRIQLLNICTQLLYLANGIFFVVPARLHRIELLAHLCQFLLNFRQMLLRQLVILFLEGCFFNFVLNDFALNNIQFCRHGVNFRANHCTRFIDQINRLIRQESVGNIPIGQCSGCNQRRILNLYAVIDFIAFLQTTQNRNGIFHCRLTDHNGLETTFQSRILFDILAILVQCRCTDAVQLAACQHRL